MTETINKVKQGLETFAHNIGVLESTSTDNFEKTKLTAARDIILKLIEMLKR